jgi:hypothetical protein
MKNDNGVLEFKCELLEHKKSLFDSLNSQQFQEYF